MAERENMTGKDDVEMMSDATLNRLLQWLTDHGHTPDEIVELLDYITGK